MMEWLTSMFGALEDGSMWESVKGVGKELASDGSMIGGVMSALKIAGGHGATAHSNVQAAPFHYQSNANLESTLNHEAGYMKNDINPAQGFSLGKNLF